MKESHLHIEGAREHNLKNLSLDLPKFKIALLTGVSGSGKSSLAFDTLYAEGQRRYMDCLSSSARSLLKQLPRPDVDIVLGLSPTLAVGQVERQLNRRTTVGTLTDIHDLLAVLYARIGEQHDPTTGERRTRTTPSQMVDLIKKTYSDGARLRLLAPISLDSETFDEAIERLQRMGFLRLRVDGEEWDLSEGVPKPGILEVVVDRLLLKEGIEERLRSSVRAALDLSRGTLLVVHEKGVDTYVEGHFAPLTPSDFNFQSAKGACPTCGGDGGCLAVDPTKLTFLADVPVEEQVTEMLDKIGRERKGFHTALWERLVDPSPEVILKGSDEELTFTTVIGGKSRQVRGKWKGLEAIISEDLIERGPRSRCAKLPSVGFLPCPTCKGARLKAESLACTIRGWNIPQISSLSLESLYIEINSWGLEGAAAKELLPRILSRIECLVELGVGYLTLNRIGSTLSSGEAQRVQLAAQIGAELSGVLYILDEPSQGLHAADVAALRALFNRLRDQGNSLLIVEHDRQLIEGADEIVELGPGAGEQGGYLTFQGSYSELLKDKSSITGRWLSGKEKMPKPPRRKKAGKFFRAENLSGHNLKNISVALPLERLVGICGVSGSGKSTLAVDVLLPRLTEAMQRVILVDQPSVGVAARSMPATYVGIMTPLRNLFAKTPLARARGLTGSYFSLNRKGGRCETCEGLGVVKVELDFLPDVFATCETCLGSRYNYEALQMTWNGYSLADILTMPISEAYKHFIAIPEIASKLELMNELGLDYLKLGQSFTSLSGGELQRLKLVSELARRTHVPTLYILDEPAVGLHLHDIAKLVTILQRLVDQGHSVWVIEHHLDILNQCDWLIELGPGGGEAGGEIIFEGTPSQIVKGASATGLALNGLP